MKSSKHILNSYKEGWAAFLLNKKVLFITYGMSLLLAFVAIGPLSNLLRSVFGNNLLGSVIQTDFDFTIVTELLRHSDVGMELSLNVLGSFVIIFFPWSVFYQGGYLALIKQYPAKVSLTEFWKGGAQYFFRFIRLAIYTLAIMSGLVLIAYGIIKSNGLNPLAWESEAQIILLFKVMITSLSVLFFLIATFRDSSKIFISGSNSEYILKENLNSLKALIRSKILLLSLLNITVLLSVSLLYALLRKLIGGHLIPAIILGQLFLVFRMMYSFVRLASFHNFYSFRQV